MSTSTKPVLVKTASGRPAEVSDELLASLRDPLTSRRISAGIALFQRQARMVERIDPRQPNAARLTALLAAWVDAGFADPELVRRVLARFTRETRAHLRLADYMHLRLAEGVLRSEERGGGR